MRPGKGAGGRSLLALFAAICLCAEAQDYMGPELRAQVEDLKADAARAPSSRANAQERAQVLWDWINAYALSGRYVPVNATAQVSGVLAYPDRAARIAGLDATIAELEVLDEHRDGLGTLQADLGPFVVRSFATIRQTYTVGELDVQPGGGFIVARHFMARFGSFQTEDETADNYLSIASSNGSVRFAKSTILMRGMHGGFRGAAEVLVFRVVSGRLTAGDTVTITYGDTAGGGRGLLMPDFSSEPHAAAPIRRFRRFRTADQLADPADRHRRRRDGRRARFRTLGGRHGGSIRADGARPGSFLQPSDRTSARLARPSQRHTRRGDPQCRGLGAGDRAPRLPGRLPVRHPILRRHNCGRRESGIGGGRAEPAHLLGRHPRPFRLRRGHRHTRPADDLGQGGRAARLRGALGARHLDGRLGVGSPEGQRRPLLRREFHRLPRLRMDDPEHSGRPSQRALQDRGGPPPDSRTGIRHAIPALPRLAGHTTTPTTWWSSPTRTRRATSG